MVARVDSTYHKILHSEQTGFLQSGSEEPNPRVESYQGRPFGFPSYSTVAIGFRR